MTVEEGAQRDLSLDADDAEKIVGGTKKRAHKSATHHTAAAAGSSVAAAPTTPPAGLDMGPGDPVDSTDDTC